ncbi:MAG: hypothetical protein Q9220_002439 [cf. Caloplaca sp. 1 TL-2023]
MHFSSSYLAFALSLATGALAHPAHGTHTGTGTGTGTGPNNPYETGTGDVLPACKMFKPYVAEVFLSAVCSLHMTPLAAGVMPTINSACLVPQQSAFPNSNTYTNTYVNTDTYQGNTYSNTAGNGPTTTYSDTGPTNTYTNTGTGTGTTATATGGGGTSSTYSYN